MAENRILSLWILWLGDNLQLAREEDVVDAMKRAADAVDAFTREW